MEAAKSLAMRFFSEVLDCDVVEIPEGPIKTADLRVSDGADVYHVEVKEKLESDEDAEKRRATLKLGEIHEDEHRLARDNGISAILRKARKQLDATPGDPGRFQLIWFQPEGVDRDADYRQAFATFYGYVHLLAKWPASGNLEGYYVDHNEAFQMPSVEALILCDGEQLQICVNEFATRLPEFRQSQLYRGFQRIGGVYEPSALEAVGKAVCCRATISRNNEAEVVEALRQQTGILYNVVRLTRYACSVAPAYSK